MRLGKTDLINWLIFNPIPDGFFRATWLHITRNNKNWHNYTSPKEDPKLQTKIAKCAFVLTNNYFESGPKVLHQISRNAIGTKVAPLYACMHFYGSVWDRVSKKRRNCNYLFSLGIFMMHPSYRLFKKRNMRVSWKKWMFKWLH